MLYSRVYVSALLNISSFFSFRFYTNAHIAVTSWYPSTRRCQIALWYGTSKRRPSCCGRSSQLHGRASSAIARPEPQQPGLLQSCSCATTDKHTAHHHYCCCWLTDDVICNLAIYQMKYGECGQGSLTQASPWVGYLLMWKMPSQFC